MPGVSSVNTANKTARIIHLGGKPWLVGGTWTAGGRYPKNPNPKKAAKEELFDPQHTSTVWLKDTEQVGWFVFEGKPQSARPLAPMVFSHLKMDMVPWRGVFRVDGGWWVVAVDDAMALHPLWDVWVPEDKFQQFYQENSSRWMTFAHGLQLDTLEESEKWLLEDADYRSAPRAIPVIAKERTVKKIAVTMAVLSVLAGAGWTADYFWKAHEALLARRKMILQQAQAAMNAEIRRKKVVMTQQQIQAEQRKIENSWQDWPRPWVNPIGWNTFFEACGQSWSGPVNDHGWTLVRVQCHWSAKNPRWLVAQKTWTRGAFATVLHAPSGEIQKGGNFIDQTQKMPLSWRKDAHDGNQISLSTISGMRRYWMGKSQKWSGVIHITQGGLNSFLAPIPKGTQPNVAKRLHPPVLWTSFPVKFSSVYKPDSWSFWNVPGMVPNQLTVVLGLSPRYTVKGMQYAK